MEEPFLLWAIQNLVAGQIWLMGHNFLIPQKGYSNYFFKRKYKKPPPTAILRLGSLQIWRGLWDSP